MKVFRANKLAGGNANNGNNQDDAKLNQLLYASGAEYSAYMRTDDALGHDMLCHEGTRVALLDRIMAWSASRDPRHVFWLSGLAGTGKSTIARTEASRCADAQRLGAGFFFVRGGGDLASAGKLVTTVAVQLAAALPALKPLICAAPRAMPGADGTAPQVQWQRFVLQPLAKVRGSSGGGGVRRPFAPKPVDIVVDALDECDSERDTAAILRLLALGAAAEQSQWLRVLLTSRPETRICYGMQNIPQASLDQLILYETEPPIVDRDVSVYLADNLRRVGAVFLCDADWPSAKTLEELVTRAVSLFIWAATAYRFISRGKAFANDRLQDVLREVNDASTPQKSLDGIYMAVLDKAVNDDLSQQEQSELCAALHAVLGTIVVLAALINRRSLSHLAVISFDPVNKALLGLPSIIAIPDDIAQPLRLHHASFRDFITDVGQCSDVRFLVNGQWQHKLLAQRCLRLMSQHLR